MFDPAEYALVDFGGGRKLERFGSALLDRPSPAAEHAVITESRQWGNATARYDAAKTGKGQWVDGAGGPLVVGAVEEAWPVRHGESQLLLQLSASGNVGLFPEQAANWAWISDQVDRCASHLATGKPRVLNLFAYTGAASLAAAAAGAEVTHVDASAPTVAWAKRNAEASGLANLPVRWLVEDALKFLRRECRRGNSYHGIIADPPTYGHGPKGKAFKFNEHLPELMSRCGELLAAADPEPHAAVEDAPVKDQSVGNAPIDTDASKPSAVRVGETDGRFMLFSCHAPGYGPSASKRAVAAVVPEVAGAELTGRPLVLETGDGRELAAGVSVRWSTPSL